MLKPTFLQKILPAGSAGTTIFKTAELAKFAGFPMFEHNFEVYSTEHFLLLSNYQSNKKAWPAEYHKAIIFKFSDLIA